MVHIATVSLLSIKLIRQSTNKPLATAAKLVIPYMSYSGILKSLNPAMIFSEITSGGGQRDLPIEGKNPDLCHLLSLAGKESIRLPVNKSFARARPEPISLG
jgi:hypothetical protein